MKMVKRNYRSIKRSFSNDKYQLNSSDAEGSTKRKGGVDKNSVYESSKFQNEGPLNFSRMDDDEDF